MKVGTRIYSHGQAHRLIPREFWKLRENHNSNTDGSEDRFDPHRAHEIRQLRNKSIFPCSPLVRRFSPRIARAAAELPIVDVASGSGRNALPFYDLGCYIICIDRDLTQLGAQLSKPSLGSRRTALLQLNLFQMNLAKDAWPFADSSLGGIINVHFFLQALLPLFERSLSPGGYLLMETFPGHGGNYLQLPKAGSVRTDLEGGFDFEFYKEGRVGPSGYDAVTVRLVARRRQELV